jgi:hypothetical protein
MYAIPEKKPGIKWSNWNIQYEIIKKTEKDSGHNEHHEKVNKRQTLAEKDHN